MAKKKFDLSDFKKKIKVSEVEYKKDKFIHLAPCLQEVMKLPGLPLGHITQDYGKSDSGKTTLMFHAAVQAQQQGILPVLIITEKKVDWNRAIAMGFDKENAIIEENLQYLEEVFDFMDNEIIQNVMDGTLPYDVMIFWDSMANTLSEKSVKIGKDGKREIKNTHMQAAAIKSERLAVLMDRVNETRKINYPKAVGAFIINSVYTEPPAFPGGKPREVVKGGNAVKYKASLMIKHQLVSKLGAKVDNRDIKFGLISKISITKNHINGQEYSGEFVITEDEILPNDAKVVKDYKDRNRERWGDIPIYELEKHEDEN